MFEDFELEDLFAKLVNKGKPVAIYTRPTYSYQTIYILSPPDFEFGSAIEHFWLPEVEPHIEFILDCTIIHGHEQGERCTNDKFCHTYGYRPTGSERPQFIEGFYRKWPQYRSSDSSSISSNDGLGDVLFEGF